MTGAIPLQQCWGQCVRAKYAEEFGAAVTHLMRVRGFRSDQDAIRAVNHEISHAYWGQMRRGKIPSIDVLMMLRKYFRNDVRPLVEIAAPELVNQLFPTPDPGVDPVSLLDEDNAKVEVIARRRNLAPVDVIHTLLEEEIERLQEKSPNERPC